MVRNYIDKVNKGGTQYDIEGSARVLDTDAVDFAVSDKKGNAIVEISGGHIRTESFDSRDTVPQNTKDDADFEIKDSEDNVLIRFKDGNIETKNFKNYKIDILMEQGTIDASGIDIYSYESYYSGRRSAFYINVSNSTEMTVAKDAYVVKYNSSHIFMAIVLCNSGRKISLSDCTYIRIIVPGSSYTDEYLTCMFNGTSCPLEEKKVATRTPSERLLYHVDGEMYTTALLMLPPNYSPTGKKVPLILWDSGDGSFKNWNTYEMGTGYEKRRIGLEYLRDQGFAVVEIYPWGSYYYNKYYNCGGRAAMPIPTHLKCEEKGVEYILSRYNIDGDNIFHLSKSGSGKMAMWYAIRKPKFNLKHIYAFAPVFDDLSLGGIGMRDYRRALMEELNFDGTQEELETFYNGNTVEQGSKTGQGWLVFYNTDYTQLEPDDPALIATLNANQTFIRKNIGKFSLLSVNWNNLIGQTAEEKLQDTITFGTTFWEAVDNGQQGSDDTGITCYTRYNLTMLGSGIPIKVIMAKNDEQTPYWVCAEVVSQLRNGGCDATIHTLASQGHSAPDMGTVEEATDITTLCGQHYDAVSVGWYMACADIQKRYLAHIDKDVYDYVYPSE